MKMMPGLISELLASVVATIIIPFLMFGYSMLLLRVTNFFVHLQLSGDMRVIIVVLQYEQCVCEVEQGSFTPLVFFTSGGMGRAGTVTY